MGNSKKVTITVNRNDWQWMNDEVEKGNYTNRSDLVHYAIRRMREDLQLGRLEVGLKLVESYKKIADEYEKKFGPLK